MQAYNFGARRGGVACAHLHQHLPGRHRTYTSLYIFNRLLTSTVTDGTNTATLASNSYDRTAPHQYYTLTCGEHRESVRARQCELSLDRLTIAATSAPRPRLHEHHCELLRHDTAACQPPRVNGVTSTVTPANNYAAPGQITTNSLTSTHELERLPGPEFRHRTRTGIPAPSATTRTRGHPALVTSPYGAVTTYTYNDTASPPNKFAMTNGHGSKQTWTASGAPFRPYRFGTTCYYHRSSPPWTPNTRPAAARRSAS